MSIAQEYKDVKSHRRRVCPNGCIEIGRNRGCAIENTDGSIKCFSCGVYWPAWSKGDQYPNAQYVKGHILDLQEKMARCWFSMQPGEYVLIRELTSARNQQFEQKLGGSYYGILGIPGLLKDVGFQIKIHNVLIDGKRTKRKVAYRSLGPKKSLTVSVSIPLTDSVSCYGNRASTHLVEKSLLPAKIQRLELAYLEDQLSRKKYNAYADEVYMHGKRQYRLYGDWSRALAFKDHLRIYDVKYKRKSLWLTYLTRWVDHGINCWCHPQNMRNCTEERWQEIMAEI